jgi:Ni/Co efflux regulator RcnB
MKLALALLAMAMIAAPVAAQDKKDAMKDTMKPPTMQECKDMMAKKDTMMKKDDAMMKKEAACNDMMKKGDAMKGDAMKGGDAMAPKK